MPAGRPTVYNAKVMLPKVIELMSEGASLIEVAPALGIDKSTLSDWTDEKSPRFNQEFSSTIKKGIDLSNAWWERNGRKNLKNKDFNYVGWYMNMRNRFGWADKQEIKQDNTSSDGSMSPKEPVDKSVVDLLIASLKDQTKA